MRTKSATKSALIACAFASICSALSTPASAQFEEWVARHELGSIDYDSSMEIDAAGNTYVSACSAATNASFITIKYDSMGNEEWATVYTSAEYDIPTDMAVDASGNVYVTGYSHDAQNFREFTTVKYNSAGIEQWVATYNGPYVGADQPAALAVDDSGNVYVTGESEGQYGWPDYATVKYDSAGNELWVARYNGPGDYFDGARALAVDASGNVYVTGGVTGLGGIQSCGTIKYDSAGNEQWVDLVGTNAGGYALAADASGNVFVAGLIESGPFDLAYMTLKYDALGNVLWVAEYNGHGGNGFYYDSASALVLDSSDNVYVTGSSTNASGNTDFATVKYDSAGNEQWVARSNGSGNRYDDPKALAVDALGNVYVTGNMHNGIYDDYATVKYDSQGVAQWVAHGPGNGGLASRACDLALDVAGDVYATGYAWNGTWWDIGTVKYGHTSVEVAPTSFAMLRGSAVSGNLKSLLSNDEDRLITQPGIVLSSAEPPIQIVLNSTAPTSSPSEFNLYVDFSATINNAELEISLYNFVTGSYEVLGSDIASIFDNTAHVHVKVDSSRFIEAGTLAIRARVGYRPTGGVPSASPWFGSIDRAWLSFPD
ncbi:MAG: SBBP repeat-containing protein [Armatimonadota bacterium]|nr:SBBP repeat-containing protein [Armatimonadota bacterium]